MIVMDKESRLKLEASYARFDCKQRQVPLQNKTIEEQNKFYKTVMQFLEKTLPVQLNFLRISVLQTMNRL
jgi:hypothetical protein